MLLLSVIVWFEWVGIFVFLRVIGDRLLSIYLIDYLFDIACIDLIAILNIYYCTNLIFFLSFFPTVFRVLHRSLINDKEVYDFPTPFFLLLLISCSACSVSLCTRQRHLFPSSLHARSLHLPTYLSHLLGLFLYFAWATCLHLQLALQESRLSWLDFVSSYYIKWYFLFA